MRSYLFRRLDKKKKMNIKIDKHNKIHCTISRNELNERNMKISELVYGTKAAQNLFNEIIKQTEKQYGIIQKDNCFIIDAIPENENEIKLIISENNPSSTPTQEETKSFPGVVHSGKF